MSRRCLCGGLTIFNFFLNKFIVVTFTFSVQITYYSSKPSVIGEVCSNNAVACVIVSNNI